MEAVIGTNRTRARLRPLAVLAALLCAPPGAASAQDPAAESESDRWKVSAELSFTDQSGNKILRLLTAGLRVTHLEKERFELDGSVQTRYGQSDGEVVARNHYASLSLDLHPKEAWSPFVFADAERDEIRRLDLRLKGGAGAKYTLARSAGGGEEVSASLALLYAVENIRATEPDPFPDEGGLARWSLRVRGSREIRPGTTLRHVSFFQPQWDRMADYLLRSETEAKVLLMERLALSVGYQISRTSRPPDGVAPNDRLLKTGLIIDF